MSNKKVRALPIALWSACILWVLFIFINSMQTGSESGQMSGNVTEAINDVLHLISPSWNVGHRFVRKAAHFSEFALLALLFGFAYLPTFIPDIGGRVPLKRLYCVLWAFPSAVLVAVVDETIQLFVEGRSGSAVDVMIDASGAACSVLVFFMTLVLINRKKNME